MAKSYYSTIFKQTTDQVWTVIRDFGTYTWTGSVSESSLEGGKSGMEVGAICNARLGDTSIFHHHSSAIWQDDGAIIDFATHLL